MLFLNEQTEIKRHTLSEDSDLVFFGEFHGSKSDTDFACKIISKLKPDFVLVEGLGDLKLNTRSDKLKASKENPDNFFHGGLTKWWVDVSLKFNVPFIGFELTDWSKIKDRRNLVETFKAREEHWIREIKRYTVSGARVLVICGDTHLRTITTPELGQASPLYNAFPKATFIRSKDGEIE